MNLVQTVAIFALPVIFAITLHEAAHGYAARHFGDDTAWRLGRISLNPLRHIDPIGTIAVPLIILAGSSLLGAGGMLFGWAKPVPVNFGLLNNPKKNMFWIALAGPAANLAMALAWAICLKSVLLFQPTMASEFLLRAAEAGVLVNISLMVLNLLPILPLDGGRIVFSLLPGEAAVQFARLEPLGFPILLALLLTNVLELLLNPLVRGAWNIIATLFDL